MKASKTAKPLDLSERSIARAIIEKQNRPMREEYNSPRNQLLRDIDGDLRGTQFHLNLFIDLHSRKGRPRNYESLAALRKDLRWMVETIDLIRGMLWQEMPDDPDDPEHVAFMEKLTEEAMVIVREREKARPEGKAG